MITDRVWGGRSSTGLALLPTGVGVFVVLTGLALSSFVAASEKVVVYTALDQIYSEPIFQEFETRTGIEVSAVYDTEASKTVGLVNRIIAEMDRPQCDVFWNNEIIRTIVLKRKVALAPYDSPVREFYPAPYKDPENYWTGFAARARVIIINTDQVERNAEESTGGKLNRPERLSDLLDPVWTGRIGLANPLFGTTGTHLAALYTVWGATKTESFFAELKEENGAKVLGGNAQVKNAVAAGKLAAGLTDTDDARLALLAGKPVDIVFPDADGIGTLLIPNTVSLIANCPHPESGKQLIDFLLSRSTEEALCRSKSAQIPLRTDVKVRPDLPHIESARWMVVNFEEVADRLERSTRFAHELSGYTSPD